MYSKLLKIYFWININLYKVSLQKINVHTLRHCPKYGGRGIGNSNYFLGAKAPLLLTLSQRLQVKIYTDS